MRDESSYKSRHGERQGAFLSGDSQAPVHLAVLSTVGVRGSPYALPLSHLYT